LASVPNNRQNLFHHKQKLERDEEEQWYCRFVVTQKSNWQKGKTDYSHLSCFTCDESEYIDCSKLDGVGAAEIEKLCKKVNKRDQALLETDNLQREHYMSALSQVISSYPPLFYVDGEIDPDPGSLRLFFVDKNEKKLNERNEAKSDEKDGVESNCFLLPFSSQQEREKHMQQLMNAGSVASFGRDGESITDMEYRNAKCISPPNFAFTFSPPSSVLSLVENVLLSGRAIRCELYRLNIYGEGGLFKSHVDTPTSENMFGSLVVCLPVNFEGGDLLVRKGGHEIRKKWQTLSENKIQWIAFYGDCEHEILPVISGYRVTLTYRLYTGEDKKTLSFPSSSPTSTPSPTPSLSSSPFPSLLRAFLADPLFLSDGGKIGIYTSHAYPHTVFSLLIFISLLPILNSD